MRELPQRPDLDHLRRKARELYRAAAQGDAGAIRRIRTLSKPLTLTSAQLAVAREYGFSELGAPQGRGRPPAPPPPSPPPEGEGTIDPGADLAGDARFVCKPSPATYRSES